MIVELRDELTAAGLDAGADTIGWHLAQHHQIRVSRATIARILAAGLVAPDPKKRPRSSYVRFEAEMPNETWQADFTHYRLADAGTDVEILSWLDDHSRYALSVTAHRRVTGPIVVATLPRNRCSSHGIPASTLTDNGMVFTTRLSPAARGGRNGFETELRRSASPRRTADPTTRPPAAKSNASNRP